MGLDVDKMRVRLVLAVCLLTGMAVALCGVIGFVGLVVPHLLRLCGGSDQRFLLPASALGAAPCCWRPISSPAPPCGRGAAHRGHHRLGRRPALHLSVVEARCPCQHLITSGASPLLAARATAVANRLAPLDLARQEGQLVALLGPNGSGKSTLLSAWPASCRGKGRCASAGRRWRT